MIPTSCESAESKLMMVFDTVMAELFVSFYFFFKSLRLWDRLSQKGWFTRKNNCWEGCTISMKQLCGENMDVAFVYYNQLKHINNTHKFDLHKIFVLLWSRKRTPHPTRLTFHVRLHSRKTKRPQPLSGHENFSGFGLIVARTPSISGIPKLVLSNQYRQKYSSTHFSFWWAANKITLASHTHFKKKIFFACTSIAVQFEWDGNLSKAHPRRSAFKRRQIPCVILR